MSRPLVYMWVAEYSDGSKVSQFDLKTGRENKGDPDWLPSAPGAHSAPRLAPDESSLVRQLKKKGAKVRRFGWRNFSIEMAAFLQAHGHKVATTYPPRNVIIEIKEGEQPVLLRRNQKNVTIQFGAAQIYGRPVPQVVAVASGPIVYVVGVKDKAYYFITEDGKVEESRNFDYL